MTEGPVALWLASPFPPASCNDALDELHKELLTIDSWVADCVMDYREAHVWSPAVPDVLGELNSLVAALHAVRAHDDDDVEVIRACIEYAELTAAAYNEFLGWGPGQDQ
jgi:hypothetical protein